LRSRLNEQAVICQIPLNSTFASGWCLRCCCQPFLACWSQPWSFFAR